MRKTLEDVACYLKETLVPASHEAYAISPAYAQIAPQVQVREGVRALRAFLCRMFDALITDGGVYDVSKKVAHAYENRISLSVYYPFLHNVHMMLVRMGYDGVPAEGMQALVCGDTLFSEKLSTPKSLQCLRFLMACGLCVEGMDTTDTKQSLPDIQAVRITYPENPAMLTGLKALAIAAVEHRSLDNQDVLLRCDYRVLKKEKTDALRIAKDAIEPLTPAIQGFVLQLHRRYLDRGLSCTVETKGFWTYVRYCYRRKDVWGLNVSLHNGYHLNVKPTQTHAYADTIQALAPNLQALISKGYGCGRKRAIGRCDGGCRGLTIPLDDTVLAMREDIMSWLDREVSCLQGE